MMLFKYLYTLYLEGKQGTGGEGRGRRFWCQCPADTPCSDTQKPVLSLEASGELSDNYGVLLGSSSSLQVAYTIVPSTPHCGLDNCSG